MSHTKEVNDEKIRIYRQKVRSLCYLAIITRSNIAKTVFELTRYLTNLSSNHVKAANHCIRYLHTTKYLAIRYSNSENEKLSNQISSSNKETTLSLSNKEMKSSHSKLNRFSHSKLNKITSLNKKSKQIFEKTANAFFANDLDRKSAENYIFKLFDDMIDWAAKKQFTVSIFITEAKLLSMLHADKKLIWWIHLFQKLKFDLD
jgi:hypothetical protein